MKYMYRRELYGTGFWKIRMEPSGAHSGQHSNVHTWIMRPAYGGSKPSEAKHCEVSHVFVSDETTPVLVRELPKRWKKLAGIRLNS